MCIGKHDFSVNNTILFDVLHDCVISSIVSFDSVDKLMKNLTKRLVIRKNEEEYMKISRFVCVCENDFHLYSYDRNEKKIHLKRNPKT